MDTPRRIRWTEYREYPGAQMLQRAEQFAGEMHRRRSVRAFYGHRVPNQWKQVRATLGGMKPLRQ